MPLLPPKDNFADLREVAEKIIKTTTDENVKRLAEVVGRLAYRSDLLEREVERLERASGSKTV
jgi:tetrahydromethanopterin S-methyltransferase subunit F